MSSLADRERTLLLDVARRSLALAAQNGEPLLESSLPSDEVLLQPGGAFVTLRIRGRLRGCIGQLASGIALVRVVPHCARASALEDPRFQPVRPEEVPQIDIEISILSEPVDIAAQIWSSPGRHGLIVSRGAQRGLLLPQVASEFRWTADRFLEETCAKAGLEPSAWKDPATKVQVFTAEVFSESGLPADWKIERDVIAEVTHRQLLLDFYVIARVRFLLH
jgi:AmmeMemoRadiSam system protein A